MLKTKTKPGSSTSSPGLRPARSRLHALAAHHVSSPTHLSPTLAIRCPQSASRMIPARYSWLTLCSLASQGPVTCFWVTCACRSHTAHPHTGLGPHSLSPEPCSALPICTAHPNASLPSWPLLRSQTWGLWPTKPSTLPDFLPCISRIHIFLPSTGHIQGLQLD